jgi:LacI family transcriptional regulator
MLSMNTDKNGITLTEIAKVAGVSVMTVSRALRNAPKVSEKRRKEILRIAEELGYRPNPEMSRLMSIMRKARTQRRATIMALINTFTRDILENNNVHLKAYHDGARARAEQLGFTPELFSTGDGQLSDKRLEQILYARGIDAAVILPFPYDRTILEFNFDKFYTAAIGRSQFEQNFHRACPNQFQSTRLSLQKCHDLGYRRPGMILRAAMDRRSGYRYSAAYLQYFYENPDQEALPIINIPTGAPIDLMEQWLRENRPDVVLGLGPKTLAQVRELGYRVPEDIGFVSLAKLDSSPESSGVDNHYDQVGAAAVDLVVTQMHSFDRGLSAFPRTVLINGTWVEGETTRGQ